MFPASHGWGNGDICWGGVSGETQGWNPSPASLCPSQWMVGWGRRVAVPTVPCVGPTWVQARPAGRVQ